MTRKLKLPVFTFILANDGFTSISQFSGANVSGAFSSWRDSMAKISSLDLPKKINALSKSFDDEKPSSG